MITYESQNQIKLPGFQLPFDAKLDPNNRWVKLAHTLPWDELVQPYLKVMSANKGRRALSPRLAVGAVLLKHLLNVDDRELIAQLQENVYLQYFVGLEEFQHKRVFDASLLVRLRKRLGIEAFETMTLALVNGLKCTNKPNEGKTTSRSKIQAKVASECEHDHKGDLILDATVAPTDITYPTDINVVAKARESSEAIIDSLWLIDKTTFITKPRTYRQKARSAYLKIISKPGASKANKSKGLAQQLRYLKRNIGYIDRWQASLGKEALACLANNQLQRFEVLKKVYVQQWQMWQNNSNRCGDRIVSLSQAHVRPIVRGKAGKKVEFGAKLNCSLVQGIAWLDRLDFDCFNEGSDMITQVQNYRRRYGYYPKRVIADRAYATRENRQWLKNLGITFAGKPLGRPSQKASNKQQVRSEQKQVTRLRNGIEGLFGRGKRAYSLGRILAKTQATTHSWIGAILLCLNIKFLHDKGYLTFFCVFLEDLLCSYRQALSLLNLFRFVSSYCYKFFPSFFITHHSSLFSANPI